jgi:hypothetical protein|tara:strand:+ start:111 stop:413 length:303 start_codon:yes stop_codon:yes gene_type:complete
MKSADNVMRNIYKNINDNWHAYTDDLSKNLRATTPVDTGAARQAWKKVGKFNIGKTARKAVILTNRVGYASILDGSQGKPTSKQAPRGIVEPAIEKTQQK